MRDPQDVEKLRFRASRMISKKQSISKGYIERDLVHSLALILAEVLVNEKLSEIQHDNCVEFRVDLYAATPDTFWRMVNSEADKLVNRMSIDKIGDS